MSETISTPPCVAIYTDNADYFAVLKHVLEHEGMAALLCNRSDLEEKLSRSGIGGAILDAEMHDAVEVCGIIKLHQTGRSLRVLAAIPNGDTQLYLSLMRAGADLCLIRPFWPPHLIAFFRSVYPEKSRSTQDIGNSEGLRVGSIELHPERKQAFLGGEPLHLGPIEFRLLSHLLSQPGRVFSRDELINAGWPSKVYVQSRTVDVHIGRIRRQLRRMTGKDMIRTARASGYALEFHGKIGDQVTNHM